MSDIPPRQLFPNDDGVPPVHFPPPLHAAPHQLSAPPLVDSAEFIQADIICSQCGYNLRGQSRAGRCPECGTNVMEAFRRGQLTYADRDWLIRVRSGMVLVFWGVVASILLGCISMIFGAWIFASLMHGAAQPALPTWINIPSTFLGILGIVFAMVVLYRLTTPEPQPGDASPPRRIGRSQTIIRLIWADLVLQIMSAPVFLIWGPDASSTMTPSTPLLIYTVVVGGLGAILYVAIFVLLMLHLRLIARRDRTPALGKMFTVVIWGGGISITAVFIGGFAMLFLAPSFAQSMHGGTIATTQMGGATATVTSTTVTSTMPSNILIHRTSGTPTTMPFARHASPPAAFFAILPILAVGECFGFVVFVLGIIAAIQFYRALSRAITHNVGFGNVFAVITPPGMGSKLPGSMGQ